VFTGDTLFAMSCGRLFEGTAQQMWQSLQKLAALPEDTRVYCGHEYTVANGEFCLAMQPDNQAIKQRLDQETQKRGQDEPTLPSSIGLEKDTNLFMRAPSAEHFAELRRKKDAF